ncbi:uncharacterized protein LOC132040689 isoform X2 [Lycium ferocissimum]|uniref:uncharacterized protein LOC132040689 isoform X2 n=1 Tax=Lycium ferocissimum TaxID=112874 RepID=UPI00281585A0|nr:uncharacterized protein LOC132040689 isoform X2 [Lycium ferocissimum]
MRRNSTLSATYSAKTDFDDDQMDDFQDEEAQDAPTQEQGQKQAADQEIEQRSQLDERDIESQTPNLSGIRSEVATEHRTLYLAALRDDWKAAEPIVRNKPSLARVAITRRDERVLHVAVAAKSTKFVEGLVDLMDKEDLKLKNTGGSTAFCFAAASGVVEIARAMAEKNEELANIRGEGRMAPITMAALFGNKAMVSYLHNVTNLKALEKSERFDLLEGTIQNDMYDVALALFKEDKTLATYRPAENHSILNMLAKKSVKISSRNLEGKSERFIHRRACSLVWGMFTWLKIVRELREKTLLKMKASELLEELWKECSENLAEDELKRLVSETNILHSAAKEGNVEFLALLIRDYPDLVWDVNQKGQTIFHVAVLHRQEKVFSLVHQIGAIKDLITLIIDDEDNYILHLAGKLGEPVLRVNKKTPGPGQQQLGEMEEKIMPTSFLNVSGAALRLQKELLWFKNNEWLGGGDNCATSNPPEGKQGWENSEAIIHRGAPALTERR